MGRGAVRIGARAVNRAVRHPINLLRERCLTVQGLLHPFVALAHERGQQPHQAARERVGRLALDGPCTDNWRLHAATTAAAAGGGAHRQGQWPPPATSARPGSCARGGGGALKIAAISVADFP